MQISSTNSLVVMTRADFDAIVSQAAAVMAQKVQSPEPIQSDAPSVSLPSVEKDGEKFLTRKETSDLLKVDFSTLWRWNKSGILKSVKAGPRRVLYRYKDVMNILTAGKESV